MPGQRVSRSELYDLVWSEPASKLAKRFGISDVMLAKVCRGSNIPKPGLGYWAKQDAGKPTKRPPLPARELGHADYIIFGRDSRWDTDHIDDGLEIPEPIFDEDLETVVARAKALADRVTIKKTLARPHAAIQRWLDRDEERLVKYADYPFKRVIRSTNPRFASKQGRRRLLILNMLLMGLHDCGARNPTSREDAGEWRIQVGRVLLPFKFGTIDGKPMPYVIEGKEKESAPEDLRLSITCRHDVPGHPMEWLDQPGSPLEHHIKEMIADFLVAGEWMYRAQEIGRYQRMVARKKYLQESAQREQQAAIQQEERRLANLEKERRQRLFEDAAKWRKAEELRAYVNAALAVPCCTEEERENRARWAAWALAEADQIDPLKSGDSEDER
ncbi:hypothetical protein FEE59_13960 [Herbaspirillum sp. RU 5E]|nr:hypothetical protein [Herbaspirillum sp. RU 5E]